MNGAEVAAPLRDDGLDRAAQSLRDALDEAGRALREHREMDAMRWYDRAVLESEASGFLSGCALAAEAAERFYSSRGLARLAAGYGDQASQCWRRWAVLEPRQQEADLQRAGGEQRLMERALEVTHAQLVESEKMAALGGLVAGVALEINSPVGVGVTAASSLQEAAKQLASLYRQGKMKKADLEGFLLESTESSQLILNNLARASELIHSFKQVAVDQSSDAQRAFNVKVYLEEILTSLTPRLKQANPKLRCEVECPEQLVIESHPGAVSQIVTILVLNAVAHAYDANQAGTIRIVVTYTEGSPQGPGTLKIEFRDDGKGIPGPLLGQLFRDGGRSASGGSGLGLQIVNKLVTETLKGSVACDSGPGSGTLFTILMRTDIEK